MSLPWLLDSALNRHRKGREVVVYNDNPYGATIGVQDSSPTFYLKPQAIEDMRTLGMTWLRFQVPWSSIEITQGDYSDTGANWNIWDDAIRRCNAAGINLCLTIRHAPAFWLTQSCSQGATLPDPQGTANFASAIAQRYDGKHGHGQIQALEIGNEDYDQNFSGNGMQCRDPKWLANVMRNVYPALKNKRSDLLVIMGAILQRNAKHIRYFMDGMWEQAAGYFDIANFHFYTCIPGNGHFDPSDDSVSNVPSFPHYIDILRQSHAAHGRANFPTWLTEFGFAINTNYGRHYPKCVTDQNTQWNYIHYCLDQVRASGFIQKAFLYTLKYDRTTPEHGAGTSDGMSIYQGIPGDNGFQTVAYRQLKGYIAKFSQWRLANITLPCPLPLKTRDKSL
ncbi:hypothetical protein EPA93_17060 [Ktedonosporobacter rubrisoli]|uniref:Glycoside hydrolase family 5 domain-containing protein n=1 Tax=Ktedonosporobacter rubrisoli TaxID=2509675 RepID=A0A4P6JQC6_KTERU|nr:cellulase family glycosylhydrolase [Ktedonosporobacter rubrisoli]QBD77609.1 hypothetical protein EPA93_17060 [Ktedonosporobacter rubrisoli]